MAYYVALDMENNGNRGKVKKDIGTERGSSEI